MRFNDEAKFEIDLQLPTEAWDLPDEDLDDCVSHVLRLCYVKGYVDATRDAKSGRIGALIKHVARLCQKPSNIGVEGPS